MNSKNNKRFLLILVASLFGGALFGFLLALAGLALYYNFFISVVLIFFVLPFYLYGIWKQLRKERWLVVVRKLIEVYLVSGFLTTMFTLEDDSFGFGEFEWKVISICIAAAIFLFSLFFILAEYYPDSRIFQELKHILEGMRIYGLLPGDDE